MMYTIRVKDSMRLFLALLKNIAEEKIDGYYFHKEDMLYRILMVLYWMNFQQATFQEVEIFQ